MRTGLLAGILVLAVSTGCSRKSDTAGTQQGAPAAPSAPQASTGAGCTASGDYDLVALVSDPACAADGSDPEVQRIQAAKQPPSYPVQATIDPPSTVHAASGARFELPVTLRNTGSAPVDAVFLVHRDAWFTVQVHDARQPAGDGSTWTSLPWPHPGAFPSSETRSAWWVKLRLAGGSTGHARVAVRASAVRAEHLDAGDSGTPPAPLRLTEVPMTPGTYSVRVIDAIASSRSEAAVLVIDPARD